MHRMATKETNITQECPICRNGSSKYWFTKENSVGRYKISRCNRCRSAFVYPRPERRVIEAHYHDASYRLGNSQSPEERLGQLDEAEQAYPNSTLDAERMVSTCERLSRGVRFLDIGAGYGYCSRSALDHGFQVQALEPNSSEREVFELRNHFAPHPGMLGPEFVAANKGNFDVVFLNQVLEHVVDVEEMVNSLNDLLADEGLVAIGVPYFRSLISRLQGRHDMMISPPDHLNYFTFNGLQRLFERHGFQVIEMSTISRFDPRRLKRKLRFRYLGAILSLVLKNVLRVADKVSLGMYINIYFRKGAAASSSLSGRGRKVKS